MFKLLNGDSNAPVEPTESVAKQVEVFILEDNVVTTNTGKFRHNMKLKEAQRRLNQYKRQMSDKKAHVKFINKHCEMVFGKWTIETDEPQIKELQDRITVYPDAPVDKRVEAKSTIRGFSILRKNIKDHKKKYGW